MKFQAISNVEIAVKEYRGQRVVTFKDIDAVHRRPEGTASRNFRANREHFIESEDFFKITPDEFRRAIGEMDSRQQNDVVLLTESGYLMLVKSFTDELAWKVQRQLVNWYFRARGMQEIYPQDCPSALRALTVETEKRMMLESENEKQRQMIADFAPIKRYIDTVLDSKNTLTVTQIAADYDLSARQLNKILKEARVQYKTNGQWVLSAPYRGKGYTESKTFSYIHSDGSPDSKISTRWTQRGRRAIHEILARQGIIPVVDMTGEKTQ